MNGLDEQKIETIWIEFKDTVDQYRERVASEEAGFANEIITSPVLEEQLESLRKDIVGIEKEKEVEKETISETRLPIDSVLENDFIDEEAEAEEIEE